MLPGNSFSRMGKFTKAVNYPKSAPFHHSALFRFELCGGPDALSLLMLHPHLLCMAAFRNDAKKDATGIHYFKWNNPAVMSHCWKL